MAPLNRPFGLTMIASLLTCIGGAMTLIMIIEVFDAMRLLGMMGVAVNSFHSFFGFLLYGITPIFFYATGLGLFTSRRWAYALTRKVAPFLIVFLLLNFSANIAQKQFYPVRLSFLRLFSLRPQAFLWVLVLCVVLIYPILVYLRTPYIQEYFRMQSENG